MTGSATSGSPHQHTADPFEFVVAAQGLKAAAIAGRRGTGLLSSAIPDPEAWHAFHGARREAAEAGSSVTSESRQHAGLPGRTVEGGTKLTAKEATMTARTTIASPLGDLLLVGEETADGIALTSLSMPGQQNAPAVRPGWRPDAEPFTEIIRQLEAYFAGELTRFDIRFTSGGTDFQRRIWRTLEEIPYGATTTYGALAEQLGLPRERIQALGAAIGANPLLLVRPCHRVIGADGSMRGYAAGVDRKVKLISADSEAILESMGALEFRHFAQAQSQVEADAQIDRSLPWLKLVVESGFPTGQDSSLLGASGSWPGDGLPFTAHRRGGCVVAGPGVPWRVSECLGSKSWPQRGVRTGRVP